MLAYSYLRFSTGEQAKGDSIRRQIAMRDAYLTKKGLTLDTSFALVDAGKSAFRGANAKTGALSYFLEAIRAGRIRKGSVLIVENLDRLSRDQLSEAIELFLGIIRGGVTVVTLQPEEEFSPGNLDTRALMLAIFEMARGHGESKRKSDIGKTNWIQKRIKAKPGADVMSARRPSWLDLVDRKFVPNPWKVEVVRRIFTLSAEGWGTGAIARLLNTEEVRPISKSKRWQDSYIYKILDNRAVLGEYQPRLKVVLEPPVDGQPKPPSMFEARHPKAGPPIKDYFPAIVDEDLFALATKSLRSRAKAQGRVSEGVTNLFTALVVDSATGSTYSIRGRNYYDYLVCRDVADGMRKNLPSIPYPAFERSLLTWLREVKVHNDNGTTQYDALVARRDYVAGQMETIKRQIKYRALDSLFDTLAELESEHKALVRDCELAAVPKYNQLEHTQALIRLLDETEGDELERLRRQIRQQIRIIVAKIVVTVKGAARTCPDKVIDCDIHFVDGTRRNVWFTTGRKSVTGMATTSDGGVSIADLAALAITSLETMSESGTMDPAQARAAIDAIKTRNPTTAKELAQIVVEFQPTPGYAKPVVHPAVAELLDKYPVYDPVTELLQKLAPEKLVGLRPQE